MLSLIHILGAPHKACHGTHGHQRVHVGRAVEEPLEAVDEDVYKRQRQGVSRRFKMISASL